MSSKEKQAGAVERLLVVQFALSLTRGFAVARGQPVALIAACLPLTLVILFLLPGSLARPPRGVVSASVDDQLLPFHDEQQGIEMAGAEKFGHFGFLMRQCLCCRVFARTGLAVRLLCVIQRLRMAGQTQGLYLREALQCIGLALISAHGRPRRRWR